MCLLAQPVGNAGGNSYLYTVDDTNRIMTVGNTVPSGHTTGRVCDINGISPCVMYRNSKVVQILTENFQKPPID
jgi:hypothetical protein